MPHWQRIEALPIDASDESLPVHLSQGEQLHMPAQYDDLVICYPQPMHGLKCLLCYLVRLPIRDR